MREVCELINGRAYNKGELLEEGKYRVLRVGNFFTNNHWYWSDLELEPSKYCQAGDLLYAWSASFGPRIWRGEKCIYHYHIWKVRPFEDEVTRDFLYYFFEWDKERIRDEQGAGATMVHVSKQSMEARDIPVPPLDDQKRIVAKLDQAFAALDRARANAEANLADVRRLFASELASIFRIDSLPNDQVHAIADVFSTVTGSTPSKTEETFYGGEIAFVKPPELTGGVVGATGDRLSELGSQNARLAPAGTVLVSCIGNLGKIGLLERISAFNQQINAILPTEDAVPEFMMYQCRSLPFTEQLQRRAGGTTVAIVNKSQFNELKVWLPEKGIQASLVRRLSALEEGCRVLRALCLDKLTDIATLRQSLLQAAFSGQLT